MNVHRSVSLALCVMCFAIVNESVGADPPAKPAVRLPFASPFAGPPLAMVTRGENTWLGDFDKKGNFIRDPTFPANYYRNGGSVMHRFVICDGYQILGYEHRSGRLMKGTMVAGVNRAVVAGVKTRTIFSYFVPEIGSEIIDIKTVDLKNPDPDRRVWNMPELIPAYEAARKRKYGDRPVPKAPDPPPAGTPAGWEFVPFSKLDTDVFGFKLKQPKPPTYARAIGEFVEFGHLSDQGDFVPDPDLPMVTRAGVLGRLRSDRFAVPRYYTLPIPQRAEDTTEDVYEYRAGRLIKGQLQLTGNFVPELGSKVLDFKEYNPNWDRRIYNLPGVLRKIPEQKP